MKIPKNPAVPQPTPAQSPAGFGPNFEPPIDFSKIPGIPAHAQSAMQQPKQPGVRQEPASGQPSDLRKFLGEQLEAEKKAQDEKPLTGAELMALREILGRRMKEMEGQEPRIAPDVTDADRERFADFFFARKPYAETVALLKGKLKIGFREKYKSETDLLYAQTARDMELGQIKNQLDFMTRVNNYNLFLQMTHINDIPLPTFYELRSKMEEEPEEGWLADAIQRSPLEEYPESFMWVLTAALAQFDEKARECSRQILSENFSIPAALS